MLTDEDIEKCREKATASYKRHYYSTRGQQVTAADDPEMHLIWEVIAAYEAKLREQKPIAKVSTSGGLIWTDYGFNNVISDGTLLYTNPAPIPEGWQLVPIEPTTEMIIAGNDGFHSPDMRRHTVSGCYKAMLNAAKDTK